MAGLWRVLTLIAACIPLPGAILAAFVGRYGPGAYLAATVFGLIFGIFNRWGMRVIHAKLRRMSPSAERFVSLIYGAALLWAYFSGFLSFFLMRALLSRS
jgi:hypothetical protein